MSSRSLAFSTMVTTAAVVSVCACAWGQAPQSSATLPKVAGEASTKPPGKLKLLVWGTAKSEEEAQTLLAEYNKAKVDWEDYLNLSPGYPKFINDNSATQVVVDMRLVLGACSDRDSQRLGSMFHALYPTFISIDAVDIKESCPRPFRQRYMPFVLPIKNDGKVLTGIFFRAMISNDYSLIVVLRDKGGGLLDRDRNDLRCRRPAG